MHDHLCRHCGDKFICDEAADECFQKTIVCQECFLTIELKRVMLVILLLAVAVATTVYLFREMKRPAIDAPVSLSNNKNLLTGEIYYENERKTIAR